MKKPSNGCQLKVKPFMQCCCKCQHLLKDTSHPTTDGKPISHQRGWICAGFAYEGLAHSGWTEHSCGCEMYNEKKKKTAKNMEEKFKTEVCDRSKEVDPREEHDWFSLTLGWAIAKGLTLKDAYQFALHIRYETDLG